MQFALADQPASGPPLPDSSLPVAAGMIQLDDPHWNGLEGGYRVPYDPRPALRRLQEEGPLDEIWRELWNELHHQGDVGLASYASLAVLVKIQQERGDLGWNFYALVACIETERHARGNPSVPTWLTTEYEHARAVLLELALVELATCEDPLLTRSVLAVIALLKGSLKLGAFIGGMDESELDEWAEERLAWSERYEDNAAG